MRIPAVNFKLLSDPLPPHTHTHPKPPTMAPKVAEKAVKAPATKAPAAKKVVKKATKGGASKKKTKAVESYKIYIYKVLKQVCLGFGRIGSWLLADLDLENGVDILGLNDVGVIV